MDKFALDRLKNVMDEAYVAWWFCACVHVCVRGKRMETLVIERGELEGCVCASPCVRVLGYVRAVGGNESVRLCAARAP